jgi:choline dehydrogenase
MSDYDFVIAGGGSAGCTLAARLSEDGARRVLLLEAGPDYTEEELPSDLASSNNLTTTHDWGFESEPLAGGRRVPLPRGRVLGGCSATNATYAVRGHRANYEEWAEILGPEWSVADVLATFRRMEHDLDVHDEHHGRGGPLPIRRYATRELSPLQRAFLAAAEKLGHARVADHNHPEAIGAGHAPMTSINVLRQSAARRYVWPHRKRPNLTIRSGVTVDRVRFEGRRAVAIVLGDGSEIAAPRIVLSAGAYGSPAILLRSGVGPATQLREHGIDVVLDRRGVGENLADHPLVVVPYAAPRGALSNGLRGSVEATPAYQTLLTFRSSLHRGAGYDMHIVPQTVLPMAESPTGAVYAFLCSVVRPRSLGRLTLRSKDPKVLPRVETGYLAHADDKARLVEAVRVARALAKAPPLSEFSAAELAPGDAMDTDDAIGGFVEANVTTYFHPVGSCRMGAGRDAVVDVHGKVHELDGLWVLDASVMPTIPGINTNLPTIMVAERGAAWLAAT